jgi:hypothetical protein
MNLKNLFKKHFKEEHLEEHLEERLDLILEIKKLTIEHESLKWEMNNPKKFHVGDRVRVRDSTSRYKCGIGIAVDINYKRFAQLYAVPKHIYAVSVYFDNYKRLEEFDQEELVKVN